MKAKTTLLKGLRVTEVVETEKTKDDGTTKTMTYKLDDALGDEGAHVMVTIKVDEDHAIKEIAQGMNALSLEIKNPQANLE